MSNTNEKTIAKKSLKDRVNGAVAFAAVTAGVTLLAYTAARLGAAAALRETNFEVDVDLPEGYEIINVAQI